MIINPTGSQLEDQWTSDVDSVLHIESGCFLDRSAYNRMRTAVENFASAGNMIQ